FQTIDTFKQTCEDILSLKPDRIALFSYAKIPWLKAHQKAIKDEDLPQIEEKFMIYLNAREVFKEHGYTAIGMDHFALEDSPLAKAYRQKTLQRNFQGYFLKASPDLIGLGVTSIGEVNGHFFQNEKQLDDYYSVLDSEQLPINRICILNEDDKARKWVISSLMCRFELDMDQFEASFYFNFKSYFHQEMKLLEEFQKKEMLQIESKKISVSKKGELFIRNIASCFDRYYQKNKKKQSSFSKAV
ncbi:MAG: oxygen-independent coproporphyrinogen III oxidase, partial [Chlamydiales bacterium]|nr:oxygen-independent coproporphyrinogen III oxidase [Chlamydiales bacterium]